MSINFNYITTQQRNFLVSAKAGAGKTYTLVKITENTPQEHSVFCCAFSNKIVRELKERYDFDGINRVVSTIHSFGLSNIKNFVKKNGGYVKVESDNDPPYFARYKRAVEDYNLLQHLEGRSYYSCRRSLERMISLAKFHLYLMPEEGFDELAKAGYDETLKYLIENRNNVTLDKIFLDCVETSFERDLFEPVYAMTIVETYEKVFKQRKRVSPVSLTFDDMIWTCSVFDVPVRKFHTVLIDECQDLSNCTRRLLIHKAVGTRFVAVGDKAQCIFRFAGADVASFETIERMEGIEVMSLNTTRRCAKAVVREAQKYVPDIEFNDDNPEGYVDHNARIGDISSGDMVVCKNNKPLFMLLFHLLENGINCRMIDESLKQDLINLAKIGKSESLIEMEEKFNEHREALIVKFITKNKDVPRAVAENAEFIKKLDETFEIIKAIVSGFSCKNTSELCLKIDSIFASKKNAVILSSIHKSKGLESDRVFILNFDLLDKSEKDVQETLVDKNNLAYVAITRAKQYLGYLSI